MINISTKDYNKIFKSCKVIAYKYRIPTDEVQDLFHDVLIKILNKDFDNILHYTKRSFINQCIDYTRSTKFKSNKKTISISYENYPTQKFN